MVPEKNIAEIMNRIIYKKILQSVSVIFKIVYPCLLLYFLRRLYLLFMFQVFIFVSLSLVPVPTADCFDFDSLLVCFLFCGL